ncbi:MAG: SurA N-terminal domain-containing protein [Bacteroidales bacterium]|nr:SurA N-terminal domain-containing protein [Bacteroidales bacterium]
MALIGKIRKQSGLLVIIIGVALAAFVLGDFLKPGSGRSSNDIGEIDGENIPIREFNIKVEKNEEIQKQNQQTDNLPADEIFKIKQQTWQQIVQGIIMDKEYNELGIVVSSDELFDQVQGENPHAYILQYFKDPQTNQYDPQLVRNYLKNLDRMEPEAKQQWLVFEKAIKDDRLRNKYKNLISKAYYMPDTFLIKDFDEKKTKAKIRLLAVKFNTIPDSVITITQDDFEEFYDEYKYKYKRKESRDINYVIFKVTPSSEDRKKTKQEVFKIYDEFKKAENIPMFVNANSDIRYDSTFYKEGTLPVQMDSIMFNSPVETFVDPYVENNAWHMAKLIDIQFRPDSMKASHILISFIGAFRANPEVNITKEQALEIADSLHAVIKKSPNNLEQIAKIMSDDPSAKENSGEMDWFADGTMLPPFNDAVLNGKVGDIVLVETMFGYHIIKITGKQKPVRKVRVAIIDRTIEPSNQTFQETYANASEFASENKTEEAFEKAAVDLGTNMRTAENLLKMGYKIPGITYPRSIIRWAYSDDLTEGSVSPVFDMDGDYVVAMIKVIREKGLTPLEQLKEIIEPFIKKEKKGDIIVEKLNASLSKSKNIYKIAKEYDTNVDTLDAITFNSRNIGVYGNESDVIGKIFSLKKGIITKPIKGNNAAFILVIDDITEPKDSEDHTIYKNQLLVGFKSKVNNNSYLTVLEDITDIIDNRVYFY